MNIDRPFLCPTLCGCVLMLRTTIEQEPLILRGVRVPFFFGPERITFDGGYEVVQQCESHAALLGPTPSAVWDEFRHLKGNAWRPDTCLCCVAYWWDDRIPQDERIHHPVNHPGYTHRCPLHAHLTHYAEHHDVVVADNQRKNVLVNAVADELAMWPEDVPWTRDEAGEIIINEDALGLAPQLWRQLKHMLGVRSHHIRTIRRVLVG